MTITSGFFNSLDGDRLYNADQMSEYFTGLVSDGVCENVGGALQVTASSGMTVQVASGRAYLDSKWLKNDAPIDVSIDAAHVTLNRYTAIVIQLNYTTREISIIAVNGTSATSPTKPAMVNTATVKQMCLAYIYVKAGATAISQSNITDTRANTNICGWVTGLIRQVDTSALFVQWQTAYEEFYQQMQQWETQQRNAFDAWLATLTEELQIGAYIRAFSWSVTIPRSSDTSFTTSLYTSGYSYQSSDVILVFINGLLANAGTNYVIDTSTSPPSVTINISRENIGQVDFKVLKAVLGVNS